MIIEILQIIAISVMFLLLSYYLENKFKKLTKETQEIKTRQAFSKKREKKVIYEIKRGGRTWTT